MKNINLDIKQWKDTFCERKARWELYKSNNTLKGEMQSLSVDTWIEALWLGIPEEIEMSTVSVHGGENKFCQCDALYLI